MRLLENIIVEMWSPTFKFDFCFIGKQSISLHYYAFRRIKFLTNQSSSCFIPWNNRL